MILSVGFSIAFKFSEIYFFFNKLSASCGKILKDQYMKCLLEKKIKSK